MKKSNLTSEIPPAVANRDSLPLADEEALVQQAKSDPLAFGKLFDRYHNQIFQYILHRTANMHIAHELTSNMFYAAMTKIIWQFLNFCILRTLFKIHLLLLYLAMSHLATANSQGRSEIQAAKVAVEKLKRYEGNYKVDVYPEAFGFFVRDGKLYLRMGGIHRPRKRSV